MTLATRYLLYILLLHAVLTGLVFGLLRDEVPYFIASELLIGLSLYGAVRLYRTFQQPSAFIKSGIEAIKDKDFSIKFVSTGTSEVDELIRVYNLMIDQLRQERVRQAEQQFFLDKLIEAAPIALLILDFDGRVSALNPRARQLLDLPDDALLGKPLSAIAHPLVCQLAEVPLNQPCIVRLAGVETYRVLGGQFIDRSYRRQFLFIEELTTELIDAEKKAYGKVIRMMAHEVNNSIGAVNSILNVARPAINDSDVAQAVGVAIARNDRLNGFMRRFADVVRLPPPNRVLTDLTLLVTDVIRLMQPLANSKDIALRMVPPNSSVTKAVDAGQLEQVLVNVVRNALDACGAGQLIEIVLTQRNVQVRNNGQPIPEAAAAKLFNPFFSTKATGQGIGLTLSRDILMNHGFGFSLQTQPDGWTVFAINFAETSR